MTINLPAKTTFISVTPQQRRQIESLIENLISMLDVIDGDHDQEDDGCDEPVLGWSATHSFGDLTVDERELDEDFELDAGDEPEWDQAEDGIADLDALHDENLYCLSFAFDRSGRETAERLLAERLHLPSVKVRGPDGHTYTLSCVR